MAGSAISISPTDSAQTFLESQSRCRFGRYDFGPEATRRALCFSTANYVALKGQVNRRHGYCAVAEFMMTNFEECTCCLSRTRTTPVNCCAKRFSIVAPSSQLQHRKHERLLRDLKPHVIVGDIAMPTMPLHSFVDGNCEQTGTHIPVITVSAERHHPVDLVHAAFVQFVLKPLDPIALCEQVRPHVRPCRRARTGRS
jgi:CheY-like chemotaxis protein